MGVQKGQSGQPFLAHGGPQVGLQAVMVPLHLLFSERSVQLVRWLSWTIRMNSAFRSGLPQRLSSQMARSRFFARFIRAFTPQERTLVWHPHPALPRRSSSWAMCFFFYVSRHFFFTKPTRARGKMTKCPKKKKTHWLSVPDHLTDK